MDRFRFDNAGNVQKFAKKIAHKSSLETSLAYILLWTALESLLKLAGSDAERIGCVFNWPAVLTAMM